MTRHPTAAAYRGSVPCHWYAVPSVTLLVALLGCGRSGDSVGHGSPSLPQFTTSDQPTARITDDGTPERAFLRATVRRLPDGTFVVADQGGLRVTVLARDGTLVRTLARQGAGPGELQGPFGVALHDDTVLVFGQPPLSPPGVSVYAVQAGFVTSWRPDAPDARAFTPIDALADGRLLGKQGSEARILPAGLDEGVLMPDTTRYGVYAYHAAAASAPVTALPVTATQWFVTYRWRGGATPVAITPYPFAPATFVVASGDRVWAVDGGTGAFSVVDADGRTIFHGQASLEPGRLVRADLERRRARALAGARRRVDSARVAAVFDARHLPDRMPLIVGVHPAPDGGVWLRLFQLDDTAPQRFLVLAPDGTEAGAVQLPNGLELQQVGRDFVAGIVRDQDGVESIVEFALRKR
jgi:hypothetical protein